MSVLAPLYFLGALAVGLPILFHLIRRQPKGNVAFSSLMFLRTTPPQLTRRSRLDNWPLLLVRALALILFAAAFSRPFFREAVTDATSERGSRIVLLIDTSASMKREGVWTAAIANAKKAITELEPHDQLAIVTFDNAPHHLFRFEQSRSLTAEQRDSAAIAVIDTLNTSWNSTDLGRALSYAAELAISFEPDSHEQLIATNLILISDFQSGSDLESLQIYTWPDSVTLDVRPIVKSASSNAWPTLLPPSESKDKVVERKPTSRVRITNSVTSNLSQFRLVWLDEKGSEHHGTDAQVPPGESRVISMTPPSPGMNSILLKGDDDAYDNRRFFVSPEIETSQLHYFGDENSDTDPRQSLLYYLKRAPLSTSRRTVEIQTGPSEMLDAKRTPLVIIGTPINDPKITQVRQYAESGGNVFVVLARNDSNWSECLQSMLSEPGLRVTEAMVDDYVMFSRIDFSHPLFEAMADPQFNDFTKVRFWSHRMLESLPDETLQVASFDDGDPAIIEFPVGNGRITVMTAGWQPEASQLALSTKFIPLISTLLVRNDASEDRSESFIIGENVLVKRDGKAINQPGIFEIEFEGETRQVAANLADSESQIDPIDMQMLERFGVVLGKRQSTEVVDSLARQKRDVELEGHQKLWQWLIVFAACLLGTETFWVRKRN